MTEDDPFVGLNEVLAVIMNFAGGGASSVNPKGVNREPFRIKAVADGIGAKGRD